MMSLAQVVRSLEEINAELAATVGSGQRLTDEEAEQYEERLRLLAHDVETLQRQEAS